MNDTKIPTLNAEEQAELTRLVTSPLYSVLTKVFEDELRQMEVQAVYNNDENATDAVIANRSRMAKAAAAYYTRVRARIDREAQIPQLDVVNEPFEDITSELLASTGE